MLSADDLLHACLSGPGKLRIPDINIKDTQGNTLLLNILITFHKNMLNYVKKVNLITNDPDCKVIPVMYANQLYKLQKLCRIIKYLLNNNADETIENNAGLSARRILTQIKNLSESAHPNGKKHFMPIKNMFLEINYSRKKGKAYENMLFFRFIQLLENHSNQTTAPKTHLAPK